MISVCFIPIGQFLNYFTKALVIIYVGLIIIIIFF